MATRKLSIEDLGGVTIRAAVPMRPKGSGRWAPAERPVAYFPALGQTAADAETFAAALNASYVAWRRAEDARPSSNGHDHTRCALACGAKCRESDHSRCPRVACPKTDGRNVVGQSAVERMYSSADRASLLALAERFATRDRAESRANLARLAEPILAARAAERAAREGADVARMLASSGPSRYEAPEERYQDVAPAPVAEPIAERSTVADYSAPMPAGFTADVSYADAVARMREQAPDPERSRRDDSGEPDANGTAVAHDFGDPCGCGACAEPDAMPPAPEPEPEPIAETVSAEPELESHEYVPAGKRAGCFYCYRPAAEHVAEPEPEPSRCLQYLHTAGGTRRCVLTPDLHDGPHDYAGELVPIGPAPVAAPEPVAEPVAPVLTVVREPAPSSGRPACPRCGQTFRKSGTGLAWHVANRPDCAASRSAVAA